MPPRKRKIEEISKIQNPVLNVEQADAFQKGIDFFNSGEYWEAHEAWEDVWMPMTDTPEDDGEIILRGLIQFTAGLHGLTSEKPGLGERNFRKSAQKLALYKGQFLGVNIPAIVDRLNQTSQNRQELEKFSIIKIQGEMET